ncbi:MAG: EAL domain-containing protein [Eubacterium sp.]|nr:EAL domain-containing protein [Eubacterium sp.]
MRFRFTIIFIILIVVMSIAAFLSRRSKRAVGRSVAWIVAGIIPPVIGNLLIVAFSDKLTTTIGYYIYFLGMDVVVISLLRFAYIYCDMTWFNMKRRLMFFGLFLIDIVQYILNPFFHNAFETEPITVDGRDYYKLIPYVGQTYHRVICYGVLFAVIIIFIVKTVRAPRIYAEKYSIIVIALIIGTLWETYYIFSGVPIDRSMIGFAVFGILIFYFSIYYRPRRLLDRMLVAIAGEIRQAIYFFDANGKCIWANDLGIELLDLKNNDYSTVTKLLKERFGDIKPDVDGWNSSSMVMAGGNTKYYSLETHMVTYGGEKMAGSFINIKDETETKMELQRERYNATHDSLTDLYNKDYLFERIRETIAENPDTQYLVIYANISDFKIVNDIFGNVFGDFVLKYVSERISNEMPSDSVYGRLVGDTFGMLIKHDDFNPRTMEKNLTHFTVSDGSTDQNILMNLGVYEVTESDLDPSAMFDRARMALSTIKNEYHVHIAYYDDEMRKEALWGQHISTQLADAMQDGQIRPYFQPIVDMNGDPVGAEALVRWNHPTEGQLNPGRFIPVFEKNGMIADIDRFMWRSACEVLTRWKNKGIDLFISINISPKDFYFMDVATEIKQIASEYDINPAKLRIEITESVMMTDNENRFAILEELREAGFLVEMDDFGSGYSSLNLLKDMPVDIIKIDMVFLRKTKDDMRAQIILNNIIRLTEDLGLSSLTEGVENENQYQMLGGMGCKLFQGYYFAKPMPIEEFEKSYLKEKKLIS